MNDPTEIQKAKAEAVTEFARVLIGAAESGMLDMSKLTPGNLEIIAKEHADEILSSVENQPLEDGSWYWVRYEGIATTFEAPALFIANVSCFYSYQFAGIPLRQVEVLRRA